MISLKEFLYGNTLNEGGNVFRNTDHDTEDINLENIEPTLKNFVGALSTIFPQRKSTFINFLNKENWLGSTGKKPKSGDVDLAYSMGNFLDGGNPKLASWGINKEEFTTQYAKFAKRARTSTETQLKVKTMLHFIVLTINKAGTDLFASAKAIGGGALHLSYPVYNGQGEKSDKRAQFDIDSGDVEWLVFRYRSDSPTNSKTNNVKGLHRGQLLLALFSVKGYTFGAIHGLVDKTTRKVVAPTPNDSIKLMNKEYGLELTADIVNNYEKLSPYLLQNLSTEDYDEVMTVYLKALDFTRADIPWDLQDYWIANQEKLGLKGKFLPADSKLIQYQNI
tara:strand:+ start:4504 stop:5508 length:1005 start_codon:yes stop_codon:yes gene_type:complete